MPITSKVFTYEIEGLSYTVTVYEENGIFQADITVTEGAMDVNAIYFGDDDFSGDSASLKGPLNMNGAKDAQWDDAVKLSSPGLGPEGEDKDTYVAAGDTLTVELDIDSLDDIDVFGIRATSTTTDEGSIKAVCSDPEEPEEPEEPEDPTFDKIGFGYEISENGVISNGYYFSADDLPEGQEPTFENYVNHFESVSGGEIELVESVILFETDDQGNPLELFRVDAPEGGFENAEDLIMAFEDALDEADIDGDEDGLALMTALTLDEEPEDEQVEEDEPDFEDDFEPIC